MFVLFVSADAVPAAQRVQELIPPELHEPAGQSSHTVAPAPLKVPAGQFKHAAALGVDMYFPAAQLTHAFLETLPVVGLAEPGSQEVQTVNPVLSAKVPTGHATHSPDVPCLYFPTGHGVQLADAVTLV